MEYVIDLPWPAPALWQNRSSHRMAKATAIRLARRYARIMAAAAGIKSAMPDAQLRFEFSPPPKSRPDLHNMPATVKAYIDGIADAMGCDDRDFRAKWPDEFSGRVKGGNVRIYVTPHTVVVPAQGEVT